MRNIVAYYFALVAPLVIIFGLSELQIINAKTLVLLFLFYLVVYRTYIDGLRLVGKDLISKKDIWKLAIPGSRTDYLRELYFETESEKNFVNTKPPELFSPIPLSQHQGGVKKKVYAQIRKSGQYGRNSFQKGKQ